MWGKRLASVLAIVAVCTNVNAKSFSGVKGNQSQYSAPFTSLSDNNVSGSAASGWYFKTASVTGGQGIKEAIVSANEKSSYTQTTDGNYFNYVTFTIVLGGKITKNAGGSGTTPTYSLKSRRDGELYIDPTEAEIPAGGSITFYGKENFLNVADPTGAKKCDWTLLSATSTTYKVAGEDYTPNPVFLVESTTCPISPSSNYKTPDPGPYTIKAKASPSSEATWKTATLKVVGGMFTSATCPGYDDFTNWTESASDYYDIPPIGYCTKPCVSVKDESTKTVTLLLVPGETTEDVSITESTLSIENLSPTTTTSASTTVSFTGEAGILSDEGDIDAEFKNTTIASIRVCSYEEKNINVLIVKVNGKSSSYGFSCFNQAIINVTVPTPVTYPKDTITVNGTPYDVDDETVWTRAMLEQLRDDYYSEYPGSTIYDYVQFHLNGNIESYTPGRNTFGLADATPSKDSWISQTTDSRTPAHELGHCLGLGHRNTDLDALMCQTAYALSTASTKLRKGEWDVAN